MKQRMFVVVCIIACFTGNCYTQQLRAIDTLPKSVEQPQVKEHSPKTAAILSAACPGLGQVYNKNYFKVPIIYAGFAGLGYGFMYYQKNYTEFKNVYDDYRMPYLQKGETPPANVQLTVFGESGYYPENVREGRDYYRRYRDLTIIGMGTWYMLSILEAYVYAHLYNFDTSDNLSLRCMPYITPSANSSQSAGLVLRVQF